ncbi:MAG: hypothetical protein HY000_37840 [Planctomycetes bacterium]|nr:hypothetical protein [Planctomycetota bacterium]
MIPEQIIAGTRTVANLATHFEELKQAALHLRERVAARTRGYFTPSEDEEVRHLLVSYWQSRNALLDLVMAIRDDTELPTKHRPAAFLVGFAAATLLVDAAWFLRDAYDANPTIREKLNEPEPHFGIPPGLYDTVQRSLTSPFHAWHLYHAVKYFGEHKVELNALARGDPLLTANLEVIDRLGERVRVSAGEYAGARLRVRARQIVSSLHHDLIGQALYGLQKMLSRLASDISTRPAHRHALPTEVHDGFRNLLEPGDVLVTRKEYALTNYFLPGYWPHAALYLGDAPKLERMGIHEHPNAKPRWCRLLTADIQEARRVLEALKDGVWIRSLKSPLSSDSVVVIRPQLGRTEIAAALARGLFHEGKPYDFDFDFTRSDRLVCTEVVYRSYEGIGGIRFELRRRAGRLTLAAEDLLQMALNRSHFEPVAVFAPAHAPDLRTGQQVEPILRAALGQSGV